VLEEYLQEYGIDLSDEKIAFLSLHLDYVLKINSSIRLTAIHGKEEGERLHILDSLLVLPEVFSALGGKMLDIGTGGGYPGLPIAIAADRSVDLLDSVKKKARAIESFLEEDYFGDLELKTIGLRAEELALERPEYYSVILARAVSSLPSLIELGSPLLQLDGQLIVHKGPHDEDEFIRALAVADIVGISFLNKREYNLPCGAEQRTVYVFEKTTAAQIELPRRSGRAQRKPLA